MDESVQKSCWGVTAKAVIGFAGIMMLAWLSEAPKPRLFSPAAEAPQTEQVSKRRGFGRAFAFGPRLCFRDIAPATGDVGSPVAW